MKKWGQVLKMGSGTICSCAYRVRLTCAYLRENTMRVIYVYRAEISAIDFVELYYKGGKENEDREHLKTYLASLG